MRGRHPTFKIEVVADFTVGLTALNSYDSDPPTEGAANNDLTLTASVGFSF
jgi:hypothetical protein